MKKHLEILKKTCASIDARTPQLGYFAGFTKTSPAGKATDKNAESNDKGMLFLPPGL
jgi:hypothetical protein